MAETQGRDRRALHDEADRRGEEGHGRGTGVPWAIQASNILHHLTHHYRPTQPVPWGTMGELISSEAIVPYYVSGPGLTDLSITQLQEMDRKDRPPQGSKECHQPGMAHHMAARSTLS